MIKSTTCFFSNLQPVKGEIQFDDIFLSKIREPLALEALFNQRLNLTVEQRSEYGRCCVQCCYADQGEYPWGTVSNNDNKHQLVCRCFNTRCQEFGECCPNGLYEEEIKPSDDQQQLLDFVDSFEIATRLKTKHPNQAIHTLKIIIDETNGLEISLEEDEKPDNVSLTVNKAKQSADYSNTDNFSNNCPEHTLDYIQDQFAVTEPEPEKKIIKPLHHFVEPSNWGNYWLTR